ncbi:hypothetical protein Tco_0051541 [Tanacetum coccineum]
MAYHDKYKNILDEIWKDKVELDGKIVKEEEEAVKRIKGEALKEKDDPGAFIFPIRLEGQVNENALADTGSDINTMPYRIYEQLGREEMKKVGVTTLIAKFLILDIPIERDAPIVVGRGFLRMIGGIVNTPERLFSTFDGFCHQTFRAARSNPAPYLNCNDPDEQPLAIQTVTNPFRKISVWKKAVSFLGSLRVPLKHVNWKPDYKGSYTKEKEATGQWVADIKSEELDQVGITEGTYTMGKHDDEAGSSRSKRPRQHETVEEDVLNRMGCDGEIDDMMRIRLREVGSNEEIFTFVAWIRAFKSLNILWQILYHELLFILRLYHAEGVEEDGYKFTFEGGLIARKYKVLIEDVVKSLSAPIYYRDLDTITLRDLIDSEGRMEIRHEAIERMEYRQSYHWDMYQGVFEHMAGVYSVPLQGAYNPPGYAQQQYDQYYHQYPPPPQYPPQYQQQQQDDDE